jgi:hypothetical protein
MHIEADWQAKSEHPEWMVSRAANAHLTILSAMVLIWLEKQYSYRPSFSAVMDTVPVEYLMFFLSALPSGLDSCDLGKTRGVSERRTYLTQKSTSRWPPPPTWYVTVIWNNG